MSDDTARDGQDAPDESNQPGISDDQLPDDVRPDDDNPLAQGPLDDDAEDEGMSLGEDGPS